MLKFIKYVLLAAILISVAGLTSSCKKAKYPSLIQGTWKRVIVEDINSTVIELWEFTDGNLIIKDGPFDGKANYVIKSKIKNSYLSIVNHNTNAMNADWLIRDLDNEKLIIINDKEGGIKTQEFIKYSD